MAILNEQMAKYPSAEMPAVGGLAFTGTSDVTLTTTARSVYIAADGDLKVDMQDGSTVTFVGLKGGAVYPFTVRKIYDTGTTTSGAVLF